MCASRPDSPSRLRSISQGGQSLLHGNPRPIPEFVCPFVPIKIQSRAMTMAACRVSGGSPDSRSSRHAPSDAAAIVSASQCGMERSGRTTPTLAAIPDSIAFIDRSPSSKMRWRVLAPLVRSGDNGNVATATTPNRQDLVRRGQRLEYFTIGYNSVEGLVSIVAGVIAGSASLIGFGLDSVIEVASGVALLWRLHHDLNPSRREQVERITLRIVGWCFVALALYVGYESGYTLIRHEPPERSIPGIIVAAVSVVVMPLLARAKRRVAAAIGSGAMRADSKQADFCTYLSAILLGGLLLNAVLGWWWADPVAGLVMVPIITKEGIDGIRGKACCDDCGCH